MISFTRINISSTIDFETCFVNIIIKKLFLYMYIYIKKKVDKLFPLKLASL